MRKPAALFTFLFLLAVPAMAQTKSPSPTDHGAMDHAAHMAKPVDARRQAEVSRRGKDVMPFDLAATVHIFTRNATGGIQRVIARKPSDARQVSLVRAHLREIRAQFLRGDFSGPSHIHGQDMPGLAELQAARPGQIGITYRDVTGGAELAYRMPDARLVTALHQWFDAQLSDHGQDAMQGHAHQHGAKKH